MTSRTLTYVKAFNEGMHQLMAADPDIFLCGEDVAGYGGVFHMFDGLLDSFGKRRVFDTPISEQAIIGLGVGSAARGLRRRSSGRRGTLLARRGSSSARRGRPARPRSRPRRAASRRPPT